MSEAAFFNRERLLTRPFPVEQRRWSAEQGARWARDFGAGLPGALAADDARFIDVTQAQALPMIAVPLCDGEFWPMQPDTGIVWQQIIHAEESMTLHRPLPMAGEVQMTQKITDIRDRGVNKGAVMFQRMTLTEPGGLPYADIDVTLILRGNGGFGGPAPDSKRPAPLPERAPDEFIEVQTPAAEDTSFCISAELKVATGLVLNPGQRMMRGVGCFGLAGRAVLALICNNEPQRLREFGVRYAGPMLTDETMRIDLWRTSECSAVFRMHAIERNAPVLSLGTVSWLA